MTELSSAFFILLQLGAAVSVALATIAIFKGPTWIAMIHLEPHFTSALANRRLALTASAAIPVAFAVLWGLGGHAMFWWLGNTGRVVDGEWETWRYSVASACGMTGLLAGLSLGHRMASIQRAELLLSLRKIEEEDH